MLALATFIPAAWSQEAAAPATAATAETPEDPLSKAVAAIKSPASVKTSDLQEARNYLVAQRQVTRPLMTQLLSNADPVVRMNATIVLANMAVAGDTSPATVQALQMAANDEELAVAYWGFQGLLNDGVPAANQSAVIGDMMKTDRPRALRLAALTTIGDRKPLPAAPIIVSHLQEILTEYRAQVETLVTSAAVAQRVAPTPVAPPPSSGLNPALAPKGSPASHPGAVPQAGGAGPGAGPGAAPQPVRRRIMRDDESGGGSSTPAVPTPATPLAATPNATRQYAPITQQVRRADLDANNLTLDQLASLAHAVEALPLVAEVHEMGMVLEDIVSSTSPDAPQFDFKTTPPWDLDKCVDKAVIYMNSHRAQFGGAPAPAPAAAPTTLAAPAATPAAPPATGTAPATTAAAPAGTTPAP
jgi:hypothetical protein